MAQIKSKIKNNSGCQSMKKNNRRSSAANKNRIVANKNICTKNNANSSVLKKSFLESHSHIMLRGIYGSIIMVLVILILNVLGAPNIVSIPIGVYVGIKSFSPQNNQKLFEKKTKYKSAKNKKAALKK